MEDAFRYFIGMYGMLCDRLEFRDDPYNINILNIASCIYNNNRYTTDNNRINRGISSFATLIERVARHNVYR